MFAPMPWFVSIIMAGVARAAFAFVFTINAESALPAGYRRINLGIYASSAVSCVCFLLDMDVADEVCVRPICICIVCMIMLYT